MDLFELISKLISEFLSDPTYYISMWLIYPLGVIFLFTLIMGGSKYKWQAGVIVCYCALSIMMPDLNQNSNNYKSAWLDQVHVALLINGAAMVAMLATSFFGRLNILQSNVLLFGVIYQYMVASKLGLEINSRYEDVTIYMEAAYYLYDYLIIITYLLMILVSYNGILTAFSNTLSRMQRRIHGDDVYYNSFVGGVFKPEKAKEAK